jgi:hypothetical protein
MRTTAQQRTIYQIAAAIGLLFATCSAQAQQQPASTVPETEILAARAEFRQASALAAAEDWPLALHHYEAAYALFAHPTSLYDIGVCHEKLGDDAQALRYTLWALRGSTIEDRKLDPEIRVQAEAARQTLETRVAAIELDSHGALLSVEVDGQKTTLLETETGSVLFVELRASAESRPVAFNGNARLILNPGAHQVTVGDGVRNETRALALLAGSRARFEWSVESSPAPQRPALPKQVSVPLPMAPPQPSPNHTLRQVAVGSLIVGGVGVLVGAIAGGVALSAKNQLDDACSEGGTCPPGEASTVSRFDTATTVSSVGFAVGLVASAAGAGILLLSPATKSAPTVALRIAPTHAAVLTSF